MKKSIITLFILQLLSIIVWSQETSFTVQPSKITIGINDYFQITYTITNGNDIKDFVPPKFEHFKVMGNPAQSNGRNISISNGKRTVENTLSLTFTLSPSKIGNYQIQPAKVMLDGKAHNTSSVNVTVVKESQAQQYDPWDRDPFNDYHNSTKVQKNRSPKKDSRYEPFTEKNLSSNLFIRLEVDKKSAYIGEQINVSYKLYSCLPMNMSLTKLPSLNGFWSEDFSMPRQIMPTEEHINGRLYQVYLLKKTALFPQQAGNLTLDAAKAEGSVRVLALPEEMIQEPTDPFEAFFGSDPFARSGYGDYILKDIKASVSSTPVALQIKELPSIDSSKNFTGAIGQFQIQSSISDTIISTDESIIYKINIFGNGNIKLINRPSFQFDTRLSAVDGNENDTLFSKIPKIEGKKSFEYVLSPNKEGHYTIPSFSFTYFDLSSNSFKTITTQEHSFNVTKGTTVNETISQIHGSLNINAYNSKTPWEQIQWIIYIIGLLVIINISFIFYRKRNVGATLASYQNQKEISKSAIRRLQIAQKNIQESGSLFYEEVSKAIWLYISEKLQIPLAQLNKEKASLAIANLNLEPSVQNSYEKIIHTCEMSLYAKMDNINERAELLDEAGKLLTIFEQKLKKHRKTSHGLSVIVIILSICPIFDNTVTAQSALEDYQHNIVHFQKNPVLYYNEGVKEWQSHNTAWALIYFESALKRNPDFKEAKDNILFINQQVQLPYIDTTSSSIWEWFMFQVSSVTYLSISLILLIGITSLHFLYFKGKKIVFYKRIQFVLILLCGICFLLGISSYYLSNRQESGIIIETIKVTYQTKKNEIKTLDLEEGRKVSIVQENEESVTVKMSGAIETVIPKQKIVIIK